MKTKALTKWKVVRYLTKEEIKNYHENGVFSNHIINSRQYRMRYLKDDAKPLCGAIMRKEHKGKVTESAQVLFDDGVIRVYGQSNIIITIFPARCTRARQLSQEPLPDEFMYMLMERTRNGASRY